MALFSNYFLSSGAGPALGGKPNFPEGAQSLMGSGSGSQLGPDRKNLECTVLRASERIPRRTWSFCSPPGTWNRLSAKTPRRGRGCVDGFLRLLGGGAQLPG